VRGAATGRTHPAERPPGRAVLGPPEPDDVVVLAGRQFDEAVLGQVLDQPV